jgi:flagellar hook-associated protein 1 FlgK
MASLLNIGASAANVFKSALDVTSANVANVATDGYSRQRVEISTNSTAGMHVHGSAPSIDSVERMKSSFLQGQIHSSNSAYQKYDQQYQTASQLEGVVQTNQKGTSEFMNRFFDSIVDLSGSPTSEPLRLSVANEGRNLEGQIHDLTRSLFESEERINRQIDSVAKEINDNLDRISQLNQHTTTLNGASTKEKNSLMDQMDTVLKELSTKIDIKVDYQKNGSAIVYMGNGSMPLISGNTVNHIKAEPSTFVGDSSLRIYTDMSGNKKDVTGSIKGGQLGGLIDVRDNVIDKTMLNTGVMLNAFTASNNWQNYQGWDLEGEPGKEIFKPNEINAYKSNGNNPTSGDGAGITMKFNPVPTSTPPFMTQPATFGEKEAGLETALNTIGDFKANNYELRYNATANEFDIFSNKKLVGTVPHPGNTQIEGLELTIDGTANYSHGDRFQLSPHKSILSSFQSMLDENSIASRGQTSINSTGTGDYSNETPAPSGVNEGLNALNLGMLNNRSFLDNNTEGKGTNTFQSNFIDSLSAIGSYVNKSEVKADSQKAVYDQINLQDQSISGVNLDEEAANLIRYQQAYEASAQIISISQSIFQTLIQSMR